MTPVSRQAVPPPAFTAAWWCRNPHLQTLWHGLLRRAPRIAWRREVLDLPDGDFVDLDWLDDGNGALVVLVHGLCGCSGSRYLRGLAARLQAHGHGVVALNLRGASGRPNRRPVTYHSGHTADLAHLVDVLAHRHPGRALFIAGFSLGGNLLLKWLGSQPRHQALRGAVAVSVPYRLEMAARRMGRGASRLYQRHLLARLRNDHQRRWRLLAGRADLDAALRARDFVAFDDALTAPVNGFVDAADYYARCSSLPCLRHVTVPTLLIHALDDPFMTPETVPDAADLGEGVQLECHRHGGHVGFVAGSVPWRARYWLEERIIAWLNETLGAAPVDAGARTSR